jgi:hypothetical protein
MSQPVQKHGGINDFEGNEFQLFLIFYIIFIVVYFIIFTFTYIYIYIYIHCLCHPPHPASRQNLIHPLVLRIC